MTRSPFRFFGLSLIAGLWACSMFALGIAHADSAPFFTSLYAFTAPNGADPKAALVQGTDGCFYGTTQEGGPSNAGTVFKITPSGTLTTLYIFSGADDGARPCTLVQGTDGNFYGVTGTGGSSDAGTVFKVTASGVLTTLYGFTDGNDGGSPTSALVQGRDGCFYGTTQEGGSSDAGTVFKITSAGALTTLYGFMDQADGECPDAALVQGTDGDFYGTTIFGGTARNGTVFQITPSGVLTTLHDFTSGNDGGMPTDALVQGADGCFYGTTSSGGTSGAGTVFKITSGGVLTTLYDFTDEADGGNPVAGLVQGADGDFYGATLNGSSGHGTLFKITPSGMLTTLVSFTGINGAPPRTALIQGRDGNFYGTAEGSLSSVGTIFKVTPSGTLTTLYDFEAADGSGPSETALVLGSDGNFYGTTRGGGLSNAGTAFKITPSGTLTTLSDFTLASNGYHVLFPYPNGLVEDLNGNSYGTTYFGGASGSGIVFKITPSGVLTTLHSFSALGTDSTNSDGADPEANLVLGSDGNLYGTTTSGGSTGDGTVFQITPSGTLTTLHSFSASDGDHPLDALIQGSDGNFYGTTERGGTAGDGTVFKITPSGILTTLYSFTNNMDGGEPQGSLVQGSDGNFYGTTSGGFYPSQDTVFKITPSGTLTTLVVFNSTNGTAPIGNLVQGRDGSFYGTTFDGGTSNAGTVFKVTSSGTLTTLLNFAGLDGAEPSNLVSGSDGYLYGTTGGGGPGGEGTIFRINPAPPAPAVTSFTPPSGPVGTVVTINGTNLGGVTAINFHDAVAETFSVNSAGTQITVTVPDGAQPGTLRVTTVGGSVLTATPFTVTGLPTISSFSPGSGGVGTSVVITGTNFTGSTGVTFNGKATTHVTVNSATQVTVTVPAGAATGPITVFTSGGIVQSAAEFTVVPPPTVTSLSPMSGPAGTVVTVTGMNLNGVTAVRFHNANATVFSANATGTQITVTVPSGALTGTIKVTTPAGAVTSAQQFDATP